MYVAGWISAERGATAVAGLYALKKNGSVEMVELRQPDRAASWRISPIRSRCRTTAASPTSY